MIISFIGHREIPNADRLFANIMKTISDNAAPCSKTLFYCGGYGNFDRVSAQVCRMIKEHLPCEVIYVTPHITVSHQIKMKLMIDSKLYDSVIYPPLETVPARFAIIRRNEWMIRESDLIIAYVKHSFGGAYTALKYAEKRKKRIINLAEQNPEV